MNKAWSLPPGAVFHAAPEKRFHEVIIFTHHFGGSQLHLHRHVRLVTTLGFDCATFDFSWHGRYSLKSLMFLKPDLSNRRFGLQHQWSLELESVMNAVPGPRRLVLFGFSGPAAVVLEVVARREKRGIQDTRALIFDSGPCFNAWYCYDNLLEQVYGCKNPLVRRALLAGLLTLSSYDSARTIAADAAGIPRSMPILSIRGEMDPLVPPPQIGGVFDHRGFENLQVLEIKNCGHLVGLKKYGDIYRPAVADFLLRTCNSAGSIS